MKVKRVLLLLLLLGVFSESVFSQNYFSRRRNRTLMFSYGLGAAQYHGDLHDALYDGMGSATGYSFGIGLRKKLGSSISLRLDINHYQIGGSDQDNQALGLISRPSNRESFESDTRAVRNLSFRARNWEFNIQAHLSLIPVNGLYTKRPIINPYIIIGYGFTTSNPKALDPVTSEWYNLRSLQTEIGYAPPGEQEKLWRQVIPFGIGIRIKASRYIDVLLEGVRRFTFTDYLDDVSTNYPSEAAIRAYHQEFSPQFEEVAVRLYDRSIEGGFSKRQVGNIRGNPEQNDAYYLFQIRLEMYLPHNLFQELFSPERRKPKFR